MIQTLERVMSRMKLRLIWNAPMNLRFTYKLNRAAVEKVAKPLQPFHNKEEVENELLFLDCIHS